MDKNTQDQTFDLTGPMGIGRVTRLMSGWGVKFFDYDTDSNGDLLVVNGHPDDKVERRFEPRDVQRAVTPVSQ